MRKQVKVSEKRQENTDSKIVESHERWKIALDSANQGVWDSDLARQTIFYSDGWRRMRGLSLNEDVDVLGTFEERLHPNDRDRVLKQVQRQDGGAFSPEGLEYREWHRDGYWIWILARGQVVARDKNNKPIRVIGTDTDISMLRRSEQDFEAASRRLKLAMAISRVGVWELDLDTNESYWDDRVLEIYEISEHNSQKVRDRVWKDSLHPEDAKSVIDMTNQAIENKSGIDISFRIVLPSGNVKHILASSQYHVDVNGVPKLLGVDRDITDEVINANNLRNTAEDLRKAHDRAERKNRELETAHELVEHNSLHDPLTGLPNRRYLDKKLSVHAQGRKGAALLHIDLDRFKLINDTLGHAAGDAVLAHTAKVLRTNTSARDFVARVGGDEFVIFVNDETPEAGLASMAGRIVKKLSEPFSFEGQECRYGVSIGISREFGARVDPKQMLIDADIALYRAKDRGRNRFEFFTRDLKTEVITNKRRADEILNGLEDNQFILHYQPQFDAHSLDIVCVEALARWQHPQEGLLYPDAFLKIAHDLNVVDMIDHSSLTQSIADLERWENMGISIPKASVNVSSQRLHDDSLIKSLESLSFKPGTLSFELLESIFLDESDEIATWNIDRIKGLGISIDIDDFGSGHASIVGLLNLRPERLKIDRQLIMPITQSRQQCDLVRSIIEIGKSLGIHVVAEGVETIEHVHILQELGCDTLQGFYFARPMSVANLEDFVRAQSWRKAS